ncbi:MAG TPA: hypothetical protein VGH28_05100 [Polyangiaceae bacterium]|jgi:hypothetical protein
MTQQGWAPLPPPAQAPPPAYFAPPPPPATPSGLYKALGIVQLVLGIAGVLYAILSIVLSLAIVLGATRSALGGTPGMALAVGRSAVNVLTGALLGVTGFGVLKAKRWSRWVGVAYASISLAESIGGTALNFVVVSSATRLGGSSGVHEFEAILIGTAVFGVLVAAIVPVVTLVALLSRRAKSELDQ